MKSFRSISLFVVLLSLWSASVNLAAQRQNIRFEQLFFEDELWQGRVYDIVQDQQGFLWLGTRDGLYKYDGYTLLKYQNDPEDPTSISGNRIWDLFEDHSGNLWIGMTDGGLNRFDRQTGRFVRYGHDRKDPNSLGSNDVRVIFEDSAGVLWIGTEGGGLNRFEPQTGQFARYQPDTENPHSFSGYKVTVIIEDRRGALWIGTKDGGLNRFDRQTGQFIAYQPNQEVLAILEDRFGVLWIGTRKGGLSRLDWQTGQFVTYRHDPKDPRSLSSSQNGVYSLYEDRSGALWVGTLNGGINHFDRETEQFTRYATGQHESIYTILEDQHGNLWMGGLRQGVYRYDRATDHFLNYTRDDTDPDSLVYHLVWVIYEDRAGSVWFGTWGGVSVFHPTTAQFTNYRHDPDDPGSLSHNGVTAVYEDRLGQVWIGTSDGLNRWDRGTDTFIRYVREDDNPESLSGNTIGPIYEDRSGAIWIGTVQHGLNRCDRTMSRCRHYQHERNDPHSLSYDFVKDLYEDHTGTLWVGTQQGLNRFDLNTGQFKRYTHDPDQPGSLSHDGIVSLHEDRQGTLWIGTTHGLNRFDREQERFISYLAQPDYAEGLANDSILTIYEDRRNRLWIGTDGGGLHRFDRRTETFAHYRMKHGLPSEVIYGILEDAAGHLWLSTSRGLSRFDPAEETFRNYDMRDGLQGNKFNVRASCRLQNGEMIFGGVNGFTVFAPQQLTDNPYIPPVALTDFQVFNTSVQPSSEEGALLQKTITSTDVITIPYYMNVISFEFAALNYVLPEKNRYAYTMEGFEKEWNYTTSKRRFATYTNLPAGGYTFRVKAANNDGVWNEDGVALQIIITPPWWDTLWFRGAVLIAVLGGVFGSYRWRIKAMQRQQRLLENQVAQRTQELQAEKDNAVILREKADAANQAKSIFLANMSHELRSPLNAILGFTQVMLRSKNLPPEHQENTGIIRRNGEHLLALINQVLDLSKIEAGRTTLNPSNFNLHRLLRDMQNMFQLRAEEKGLYLRFAQDERLSRFVRTDEVKLRQVLINLLDNAIKFTEEGGVAVRVSLKNHRGTEDTEKRKEAACPLCLRGEQVIQFEIEDSGPGIAPEEMEEVFEAFGQSETGRQSREGTGLGLPISRTFVQLMGGDMHVISHGGHGATFTFEIQCELTDSSDKHQMTSVKRAVALESGQARYRLLIVDDNPDNRRLLAALLTPFGFDLREAANGREAIELWKQWKPHLIWMDMRMPVMDGYETAQQIREMERQKALRPVLIIALTAGLLEDEREEILSAGCDAYLHKPFRDTELFELMSRLLDVRFVYERGEGQQVKDERPFDSAQGKQKAEDVLTPEALAALSVEWLAQLQKGAEEADPDMLTEVIEQIRPHNVGLADLLAQLVDAFEYDEILALVQHTDSKP